MILCDIHNPTGSKRTFFDGLNSNKPITIDSGETKTGVKLAEHVVALLKRAIRPDLKITERETPVKASPKSDPYDVPLEIVSDGRPNRPVVVNRPRGRPSKQTEAKA